MFLAVNLFQQVGRREDFPFTYFGMHKGGRKKTSNYYQFYIIYSNGKKEFNINESIHDIFLTKKKLKSILLDTKYKPNNDTTHHSMQIIMNRENELNHLFKSFIIPHLKKINIYDQSGVLKLYIKYWKKLTIENRKKADREFIYHSISINKLESSK